MPEPDLLVTKFTIPPVRSLLLQRSHLLTILDQSRSFPLTLLSASAGFGKTTLLSTWASQSTSQVAWLTLDEQDNNPTRFWAYVIAALRHSGSPVGEATLALLHSPHPALLTSALTALINELAALAQDTALILDDYHLIREQAIHESLQFMLDHLPPCLHLLLASRADPQLPLARLRARGQVVEILEPLPEGQQRFLIQTAVLERMNAEVCQALTGEKASQQMLESLERANLFLVPLDEERCWYRFHTLFREVLLARLQASQPEQVARLHREAALWYQQQGWPHEAIPHALATK